MSKLRILFGDRENSSSVPMASLKRELSKIAEMTFIPPLPIQLIHPNQYDVFVIGPFASDLSSWQGMEKINIPKIMICSDPQSDISHHVYYAEKYKIKNLFMIYPSWINVYRSRCNVNYVPFPWWSDDYFVPTDKTIDVMYSIANSPFYPMRYEMQLNESIMRRFGNVLPYGDPKTRLKFEDYITYMTKAKISAFDGSTSDICVLKYIEGMCLQTCIVAPISLDMPTLRLWDEENYVQATYKNVFRIIKELLKDKDRIERISRNGRETYLKYHTTQIRAEQFIEYVTHILNGEKCLGLDGSNTIWEKK